VACRGTSSAAPCFTLYFAFIKDHGRIKIGTVEEVDTDPASVGVDVETSGDHVRPGEKSGEEAETKWRKSGEKAETERRKSGEKARSCHQSYTWRILRIERQNTIYL